MIRVETDLPCRTDSTICIAFLGLLGDLFALIYIKTLYLKTGKSNGMYSLGTTFSVFMASFWGTFRSCWCYLLITISLMVRIIVFWEKCRSRDKEQQPCLKFRQASEIQISAILAAMAEICFLWNSYLLYGRIRLAYYKPRVNIFSPIY